MTDHIKEEYGITAQEYVRLQDEVIFRSDLLKVLNRIAVALEILKEVEKTK